MSKRGRKTRNIRNISISLCKCEECGNDFPVPRKNNKFREKGHIKTIYCPFCKKKTQHVEQRYCDNDFKQEMGYES